MIKTSQQAVLFSQTPRCQIPGQLPQKLPINVNVNSKPSSIDKPPQTPNTPPPPPVLTASASLQNANKTPLRLGNVYSAQSARSEVVAITPQSHHGGSASNHSTASNNTSATTVIESAASHSSHSSQHSPSNTNQIAVSSNPTKLVAPKGGITCVPKIAPPTLANPLPAINNKTDNNNNNIIIPLETQQYNALLTQMYGNQVPSINGYGTTANAAFQQVTVDNTQYNNGYVARNGYAQSAQGMRMLNHMFLRNILSKQWIFRVACI